MFYQLSSGLIIIDLLPNNLGNFSCSVQVGAYRSYVLSLSHIYFLLVFNYTKFWFKFDKMHGRNVIRTSKYPRLLLMRIAGWIGSLMWIASWIGSLMWIACWIGLWISDARTKRTEEVALNSTWCGGQDDRCTSELRFFSACVDALKILPCSSWWDKTVGLWLYTTDALTSRQSACDNLDHIEEKFSWDWKLRKLKKYIGMREYQDQK